MINKKIDETILSIKRIFSFERQFNLIISKIKKKFNIITYYHNKYEIIIYKIKTFSFFKFIWSRLF